MSIQPRKASFHAGFRVAALLLREVHGRRESLPVCANAQTDSEMRGRICGSPKGVISADSDDAI